MISARSVAHVSALFMIAPRRNTTCAGAESTVLPEAIVRSKRSVAKRLERRQHGVRRPWNPSTREQIPLVLLARRRLCPSPGRPRTCRRPTWSSRQLAGPLTELNWPLVRHQRRRHLLRVERLGRLEAAEHLHVGDVGDGRIGIRRRVVFGAEQFGELLARSWPRLVGEAGSGRSRSSAWRRRPAALPAAALWRPRW